MTVRVIQIGVPGAASQPIVDTLPESFRVIQRDLLGDEAGLLVQSRISTAVPLRFIERK
jgi:hypothetical protein